MSQLSRKLVWQDRNQSNITSDNLTCNSNYFLSAAQNDNYDEKLSWCKTNIANCDILKHNTLATSFFTKIFRNLRSAKKI